MFGAVRGSWQLLTRRRKLALLMLASGNLLLNLLDIVAISLIGAIGAVALGGTNFVPLIDLSTIDSDDLVFYLLAIAAALFSVKTVGGVVLARAQFLFLARIETEYSMEIAKDVLGSDLSKLKGQSRSELEWSVLRSSNIAFSGVLGKALVFFGEAGLALLVLGLFLYTDWIAALIILIYFSMVLGSMQIFSHRQSKMNGKNLAQGSISVGQAISDSIVAFKEISVLSRLDYFIRKIRSSRTRAAMASAKQSYMQAIPRLISELALILGAMGFLFLESARSAGNPDFGLLSIFIVGSLRMMSALLPLQRSFMELRFLSDQAIGAQAMIRKSAETNEFRETSASFPFMDKNITQPSRGLSLQVTEMSFTYQDRTEPEPVLKNINLSVMPGQTVAIIGPSGAGKSTLVDLILGLHEPTGGQIRINGIPPKAYREFRPGEIGYVPQKPGLVSGSIRENIALGIDRDEMDEESLADAIERAEITNFVASLPDGLDSSLGSHADSLSGGQIQRIGLARALYTRPKLLVLDEATSALDAEIEASISSSLQKLSEECTVMVVAHRLSTIQGMKVVVAMVDGEVVSKGSFKEVHESSALVRKYVSLMEIK